MARSPPAPSSSAAAAPLPQPAGAEFFRRRLQRAMAIPPEQRDPAVHAFVTSVQLMRAADELLPLTAAGEPALPADALETQLREVQAMLLAATAMSEAAVEPEWEGQQQHRLTRYVHRRIDIAGGDWEAAYLPAMQPLGGLLLRLLYSASPAGQLQSVLLRLAASMEVQSARGTVSRQLQEAQNSCRHLLLTADQLEAALCLKVSERGCALLLPYIQGQLQLSAGDRTALEAAMQSSCDRLLVLEPASPKASMMASTATTALIHPAASGRGDSASELRLWQRGLDLHLCAFRAAQAMHSPYWAVSASCIALALAIMPGVAISGADLAALVAAAEEAPPAVQQLRRVLPHSWVAGLDRSLDGAATAVPVARMRLAGPVQPADAWRAADDAFDTLQAQQDSVNERHVCSGCGRQAIGLRRCARCKQAAYCSRECQVRHWPQHKRECKSKTNISGGT